MTSPIKITLYHHKSQKWTEYLKRYSTLASLESTGLITTAVEQLPAQNSHQKFAELPERLRRLLFFGKPDIVICLDDDLNPVRPIFAFDVTEHVAAADHWMQRFPNLVGCAQEGVPGVFVTPGDMPHRPNFTSARQPNFYYLFDRVIEIHQTPLYIAEWPSSDGEHLDPDPNYGDLPPHDNTSIRQALEFFSLVLDAAVKGQSFDLLMHTRLIVELRADLRQKGYSKLPVISDFRRLTAHKATDQPLSGLELQAWLSSIGLAMPDSLPERIGKRDRYLVFTPRVGDETPQERRAAMLSRIKEKGGDPYGPQPLVFDYMFCRLGTTPFDRDTNLVIDFSFMHFSDFSDWVATTWSSSPLSLTAFAGVKSKMSVYSLHLSEPIIQVMKNFVRWQVFAADLIVFEDGVLAL